MDTTNKWRYRFYNKSLVTGRVVWCCALQVLADTFAGFGFVLGTIGSACAYFLSCSEIAPPRHAGFLGQPELAAPSHNTLFTLFKSQTEEIDAPFGGCRIASNVRRTVMAGLIGAEKIRPRLPGCRLGFAVAPWPPPPQRDGGKMRRERGYVECKSFR